MTCPFLTLISSKTTENTAYSSNSVFFSISVFTSRRILSSAMPPSLRSIVAPKLVPKYKAYEQTAHRVVEVNRILAGLFQKLTAS